MEKFIFFSNIIRSKEDLLKYSFEKAHKIDSGNHQWLVDNNSFKIKVHLPILFRNITTFEQIDKAINSSLISRYEIEDYDYGHCADFERELLRELDTQDSEIQTQADELNCIMTTYTIESSQTNEKIYLTLSNHDILNKTREELINIIGTFIVDKDLNKTI